ncbi:NAD(P)H-dependent oxidoreductase [Zavarzinia compransoris]|uniref:FMN reductase n=1 Tax=Zavarzinia compransoris TaxID=1264899 RepID=A0A317E7V6_9PROT|nr:NAD(P)H-dependent oxidoreductase [Zavarzinia compransoris]PWR23218.1 FMN reductase [Zavarzinia compransoris]TDP46222.1 FMN reductase [Zavarzinia compransoris]
MSFVKPFNLVSINGSPRQPSRTGVLVRAVADAIAVRIPTDYAAVELAGADLLAAPDRARLSEGGEALVRRVETADVLVVGTPVYRASYSGLFKHLFDLVHLEALAGKVAVLVATGGSPLHGLVTEHQLRPLLGFFGAYSVPTAIYAAEADFVDYRLTNPAITTRIERAASEAARLLDRQALVAPSSLVLAKSA